MSDLATRGTELAEKLGKLSDQMNDIVKNVRDGKGTVGRLFNDESLYNNLNATIQDAEDLARQIKSGKAQPADSFTTRRFTTTLTKSLQT
jgi:phospholipid/cholesterol/gamma-HCH transport system substrate-binding protein